MGEKAPGSGEGGKEMWWCEECNISITLVLACRKKKKWLEASDKEKQFFFFSFREALFRSIDYFYFFLLIKEWGVSAMVSDPYSLKSCDGRSLRDLFLL